MKLLLLLIFHTTLGICPQDWIRDIFGKCEPKPEALFPNSCLPESCNATEICTNLPGGYADQM